jgi:thiol-disulfide isomerase/thioredoxin
MSPSRTSPIRRLVAGLLALGVALALPACAEAPTDPSPYPPTQPFTACAAVTSPSAGAAAAADRSVSRLPDLTLPCAAGGPAVALRELRGPLVITLWASWCLGCQEELPALQRLADTGKVPVLGVITEDPRAGAPEWFAHDFGVSFPSVRDPEGSLLRGLGEKLLPLTIIVRPDGELVIHRAPVLNDESLRALVAEHLGLP